MKYYRVKLTLTSADPELHHGIVCKVLRLLEFVKVLRLRFFEMQAIDTLSAAGPVQHYFSPYTFNGG